MRTTLNVDDRLIRLATKIALERGITLTHLFEDALRATIAEPRGSTDFRLHWEAVQGRRVPEVDIADRGALHDRIEFTALIAVHGRETATVQRLDHGTGTTGCAPDRQA